jgi:DNA-binding GntR family transcriptional regulator
VNKRAKVIDLPSRLVKRLDPSKPAAEQISASLKKAILDMSLVPGQIISETEIGKVFGASRTPVRESFSWLKSQGLVVTYPSRGSYVSKLSIPQMKGSQFVRESLEVSIAERLCERGLSDETLTELQENLDEQKDFVTTGEGAAFHTLDDSFHAILRLRVLSLTSPEHLAILLADHQDIFDAIRNGEVQKARQSVRKHLRRVLDTLSDLFVEHHEYFEKH